MTTKEYYIAYFCSKDRKHWHYEKMFCSYDECENKCKEKIAGNYWYSEYDISSPDELMKDLHTTFLCTPYVYLPEIQEWFHPYERIPYPKNRALITKNFAINSFFDKYYKEEQYERYQACINSQYDDYYDTTLKFKIKFITDENSINRVKFVHASQEYLEYIKRQLRYLKRHKQTIITYSEDSYDILWKTDEAIRFFSGWNEYGSLRFFDYLIPKEKFYTELDKMFKQVKKLINQDQKDYKKYLVEHGYPKNYKIYMPD